MFIEQQYPVRKVLKFVGVSSSSYYFEKSSKEPTNRGVKPSDFTLTTTGQRVPNEQVVTDIKAVLAEEFVDYGYPTNPNFTVAPIYTALHKEEVKKFPINKFDFWAKKR